MSFTVLLVNFGIVACILALFSVIVFLLARFFCDNSVMDIAYGPAFFVGIATAQYFIGTSSPVITFVMLAIAIWSVRLSTRIFRKNYGKPEDARYAKWREAWTKKSRAYFLIRSYLQINLLQIVIILLVSTPAIIALSYPAGYSNLFLFLGTVVFLLGLIYETIADHQLDAFIKRKKAGTEEAVLMTQGLFKYSRRPNYFGETLVWWGLAITVLPLPFGFLGLISPLLITYIVTKVTGPMLEDAFLEKYPEEYQRYIDTTNYFIPGSPKSNQP
jgi:steroid 5-alpha reductase family enzyme